MSIKVFHIITHLDLGGAERVAINIAKSSNKEFEYHVVEVVRGKSEFTQQLIKELQVHGINLHRSPVYSNKLGIMLFPLWFFFVYLKERPDIIHTHTEIPDLGIFLFHFIFPWHKVYIRTIHNTELWSKWKSIGNKVEKFFISRHSNVAISQSVSDCYAGNYHPCQSIPLIYNGVEKTAQKIFPCLSKDKVNILFAGRLERQKGIDVLVEVINRLKIDERLFFHIVGDGSLRHELEKLSGVNYRTYDKIYGLSSYMGSFDYMFMPSEFEGLALTAIEACYAKVPVIINSCNGLEEIFSPNWPLKVQNNSIKDFVDLFSRKIFLLDRNKLADSACQFAMRKFSIVQMQTNYEQLYYERTKS